MTEVLFIIVGNVKRGFLGPDLVEIELLNFCFDSVVYVILFKYILHYFSQQMFSIAYKDTVM